MRRVVTLSEHEDIIDDMAIDLMAYYQLLFQSVNEIVEKEGLTEAELLRDIEGLFI